MTRCNCFHHKNMPIAPAALIEGEAGWELGKVAKIWIRSARERFGAASKDNACNNMREFQGYGRAVNHRMGKAWQLMGTQWHGTNYPITALSYINAVTVLVEDLPLDAIKDLRIDSVGHVVAA